MEERSLVNDKQAHAYCSLLRFTPTYRSSSSAFRLGSGTARSIGKTAMRLLLPEGIYLALDVDVVEAEIPPLSGLDGMKAYGP